MTWQELAEKIGRMTNEQKNHDVTIFSLSFDEAVPMLKFEETKNVGALDGILDEDNFVIVTE